MRVKITLKFGYSDYRSFVLPAMDIDDANQIALAIAQSQRVEAGKLGDHTCEEPGVFVVEPTEGISVELVDDGTVITKRQFVQAKAQWEKERAAKEAEKARIAADKAEELANQPA